MANGRLGASTLSTATNTTVYTCPADTFSVVTVNVTNRASTSRDVRIAVSTSGSPTTAEYIEYDVELLANGVIERTGIVLAAGQRIVCYANSTDTNAVVYGIETSTL
jgi:siroheme synthase (precorrin-2 oxidase/ferrochelatase)